MAELSRRDWLLFLFDGADLPLDRVRIQKAMFLFAERSKAPAEQKYSFEPYNYGPFSFEIYPDLDWLSEQGHLAQAPVPWMSSPVYSLTAKGREAAKQVRRLADGHRLSLLQSIRAFVLAHSFDSLLKEIYRLYPGFAKNSVFKS